MALTFPRVPPVAKGQDITSAQVNLLAEARNQRWNSGLGDCHWREAKWYENFWRQMRNPDETGLNFPLQGEYWYLPGLIDPSTGVEYPADAGPGEPEGANLANPANQFVFGNPIMASEDERLSEDFPLEFASTASAIWASGKAQRGAIASDGSQFTPALSAALNWTDVQTPYYSPQLKTFGGYFPSPTRLLDSCDSNPDSIYYRVPSVEIKFTNTIDGTVVTYPGTCPHGSEFGGAGQVLFNVYGATATYVAVDNGDGSYHFDIYPLTIWTEGPYESAPTLNHGPGLHIQRALWQFIIDFRGTADQRNPDDYDIEAIAFDFQKFLTKQYPLSPNYGEVSGDSIAAQYPTARTDSDLPADSLLTFIGSGGGSDRFTYQPGFVLAGIFAAARNLARECTLNVLDESDTVIGSLTIAVGTGRTDAMLWLDSAITPESIRVQLATPAVFGDGGGALGFEANQLYPYRPQYYDAYLVLRESATRGGFDEGNGVLDGSGVNESGAKEIYDSLARNGCVLNAHGALGPTQIANSITINPVYDAMRRMSLNARIIIDDQFSSYEVGADGKSVLTFKRYAYGDHDADVFQGIAPSYLPVTELTAGEVYIVRGAGTVSTSSGMLSEGQRFTAIASNLAFKLFGDAQLYVYEGIRTVALDKGYTNEWNISFEFHPYHWSESSQWKESAYSKYFTGINRGHFYSASIDPASEFGAHINFTPLPIVDASDSDPGTFLTGLTPETVQGQFYNPECPTGYNYAQNSNGPTGDPAANIAFYKSRQIYQAPYQIESATVRVTGGQEFVAIKLNRRMDYHASAPATVSADVSSWSDAEINALRVDEDYRTDDNAIREFFLYRVRGLNATVKIGDNGVNSFIQHLPDAPYGCVIPKGFCVKGIEKVKEDGNNRQDAADTRCTVDIFNRLDISIQVGCEGFVDGRVTQNLACRTGLGGLYDYTYSSIIFHATGRAQNSPLAITDRLDAAGFSVLPNTYMMAQQYNDLAACYNLMTRARIMLPWDFESKSDDYSLTQYVTPQITQPDTCADGADSFFVFSGSPGSPPLTTPGSWTSGLVASGVARSDASFNVGPVCNPGVGYQFISTKNVLSYRSGPLDPDALNAIPAYLQDLMVLNGTGFLALYNENSTITKIRVVPGGSATMCDSIPATDSGGTSYEIYTEETIVAYNECRLFSAGTFDPGTAPAGAFSRIHDASSGGFCGSGSGSAKSITPIGTDYYHFFEVPLV